jgi:20S proteasome subunit beta 2
MKYQLPKGGFNFENVSRNMALEKKNVHLPKATSTGTTIVGVIFKDGVVLGADTRATDGDIVADKNCEKIHYLAPNLYCGGAGTAADTEFSTALVSSQLELHSLATGREPRAATAVTALKQMLYKYHGHISAALIIGGFDVDGPQLWTVFPHGSIDNLPYVTMGSGSLAAMGIFESRWHQDMARQDAIEAGIFNDMGSGSNVDIAVIEHGETNKQRSYAKPNERGMKEQNYKFQRGTTAVLKESIRNFATVVEGDQMDTS